MPSAEERLRLLTEQGGILEVPSAAARYSYNSGGSAQAQAEARTIVALCGCKQQWARLLRL